MTVPAMDNPSLPWYWRLLERFFQRAYQIETLDNDPDCLLAYNLFDHRGQEVRLQCGQVIRTGDRVMELHFRREVLLPLIRDGRPERMALGLLRLGDRDMPRLVQSLEREARLGDVKAVHALTLFHRGVQRYGFEVMPVRERHVEGWFTWWHRLLMARDHARGAAHVRDHGEKLVTRHIWASREALIRRYRENDSKRRAPGGEASLRPHSPG